jgi:hypothetical protein
MDHFVSELQYHEQHPCFNFKLYKRYHELKQKRIQLGRLCFLLKYCDSHLPGFRVSEKFLEHAEKGYGYIGRLKELNFEGMKSFVYIGRLKELTFEGMKSFVGINPSNASSSLLDFKALR